MSEAWGVAVPGDSMHHPNATAAGRAANVTMQGSGSNVTSTFAGLGAAHNATQDVEQGEEQLLDVPAVVTAVGPIGHVRSRPACA